MDYDHRIQASEEYQHEPDDESEEKPKTKRRKLILFEYESEEDLERETDSSGSGDATKVPKNESEKKSKRKKKRIDKKKSKKRRSRIDKKPQPFCNPDFDPNDPDFLKLVEDSKIISLFPGAILDSSSSHFPHDLRNVPVLGFKCSYFVMESESDSGSEVDLEKLDRLLNGED